MGIRQSFCYPLYVPKGAAVTEVLDAAARIGYDAVEFWARDDSHEAFIREAQQRGLVVASMCGHQSLTDGLNRAENHDRIEAEIIASIDYARQHEIPNLICFSGNRQPGMTEEQAVENCAKGLRRVASRAEEAGINLNVELLNSLVDHPSYQCDHTAWGVGLCEKVGSPRVKLLYDIYHMQIMEGNVIDTIRRHVEHIGHMHTAGVPGRFDLDDAQELNYPAICRAIAATGYDGYLGHEFKPKGDPIEALEKAFAACHVS